MDMDMDGEQQRPPAVIVIDALFYIYIPPWASFMPGKSKLFVYKFFSDRCQRRRSFEDDNMSALCLFAERLQFLGRPCFWITF